MKKIMRMFLGNRMRLVSLAGGYLSVLGACADSAFVAATEHPMQTLQLNTRLSSKSWVNQVGIHY